MQETSLISQAVTGVGLVVILMVGFWIRGLIVGAVKKKPRE
ncbi:hypothetical protein [Hyphomonas johnsonii]|nr:hypothetical protein [Hyphomonas johnsonii]